MKLDWKDAGEGQETARAWLSDGMSRRLGTVCRLGEDRPWAFQADDSNGVTMMAGMTDPFGLSLEPAS